VREDELWLEEPAQKRQTEKEKVRRELVPYEIYYTTTLLKE
jgi:hypothetical protein